MNLSDKNYLFIVGQPKAGTSSLFKWLLQHPDICGSNLKEARFFLDRSYPLERPSIYDGSNLDEYMRFFEKPDNTVLMDASPDYLYNQNALDASEKLPNAKAVVILRDPVERVISAFRFFKQGGRISSDMTLSEYVLFQDQNKVTPQTPVEFRALDHCRTEVYLGRWKAAYGDRLLVLDFEVLKKNPHHCVESVTRFLGLKDVAIDSKSLGVENRTKVARSQSLSRTYNVIRRKLSQKMIMFPAVKKKLKPFSVFLRSFIYKELVDPAPEIDAKTVEIIKSWSEVKA